MDAVRISLLALGSIALVGCASDGRNPSFADRIGSIEDDWRDGRKDLERGEDLLEDGQRELTQQQRRRERELEGATETRIRIANARSEISSAAASGRKASEIEKMGDRLNGLQKRLDEHEEEAEDAQDDIKDAKRKIAKGESLIREGRREMAAAERRYREDVGSSAEEAFGA